MNRPDVTKLLTDAASLWLCRRPGAIYSEVPISDFESGLRLDLVHLGPRGQGDSIGVEVKSCREDFTSDQKLQRYIGRVNYLYVVTLPDCVQPEELPEGVGLLELNFEWPGKRTLGRGEHWPDVFSKPRAEPVRQTVTTEHEVDLLRGMVLSAYKVCMAWGQRLQLEDQMRELMQSDETKSELSMLAQSVISG